MSFVSFFFFNDTATTEIYTLSLHDALPISLRRCASSGIGGDTLVPPKRSGFAGHFRRFGQRAAANLSEPSSSDRKSTRLNSSHANISYAVFCLKKKKKYCSYKGNTTDRGKL